MSINAKELARLHRAGANLKVADDANEASEVRAEDRIAKLLEQLIETQKQLILAGANRGPITVSPMPAPTVNVAAPSVSVAAPNVTVKSADARRKIRIDVTELDHNGRMKAMTLTVL